MNIYSGKSDLKHLTIRLKYNTLLMDYLTDRALKPHNRRRWTIIKRDQLKALLESINRYAILNVNDFDFEIDAKDVEAMFHGLPKLLETEQQSFRLTT